MNDFLRLMNGIIDRPALYVGNNSIRLVFAFVSGYVMAAYERGDDCYVCMSGFQEFIEQRCNDHRTLDWCSMLIEKYGERNAMEHFVRYWREYISSHNG